MSRSSRHRFGLGAGLLLLAVTSAAALAACDDGGESTPNTGAALAERWLRLGEDHSANVVVYEGALPPSFRDLLNPAAEPDAPEDDQVAFPVHPEGELLGSYLLRRSDASHIVWLFYDVPEGTLQGVTDTITPQLDATPWQVVGEQGNRSFMALNFQSTRSEDVTGSAVVEAVPPEGSFEVVVDRDGEQVTLEVPRHASAPPIEADLEDDLTVAEAYPGLSRTAGLREGDRIVRVAGREVSSRVELQRTLEEMASGPRTISITYILQFAPPASAAAPGFVPVQDLALPAEFPARDAWSGLIVDEYQTAADPTGDFYLASLLSEDSPSVVTVRVREGLEAAGWEVLGDEASGTATTLQFEHADEQLSGMARVDRFPADDSFTQVFVQIQTAAPAGN